MSDEERENPASRERPSRFVIKKRPSEELPLLDDTSPDSGSEHVDDQILSLSVEHPGIIAKRVAFNNNNTVHDGMGAQYRKIISRQLRRGFSDRQTDLSRRPVPQ